MSNNHRFKLSHLMPHSWFYKLRDMKRPKPTNQRNTTTRRASKRPPSDHYYHGTTTPKPLPISPPHKSYSYTQTKKRSLEKLHHNPKAIDIHFPKDHHHSQMSRNAIVDEEFQDLRLRPIRTRPTSTGLENVHGMILSGTCPSSPRLRSRRLDELNGCRVSTTTATSSSHRRSGSARASFAVVKASTDPWKDFRESMVEMIVENEMRAPDDLEDLLECYLSLNSKEYHAIITKVFQEICRLEVTDAIVEGTEL